MAQFSPRDLDLLVRTVAGEDSTPEGQAAVAHVALNRLAAGNFGKSLSDIVLAPGQFEPWQARGRELASMPVNSKQYQQAWQAVQGVTGGDIPDPTGGATHFFAPVAQRALGRLPPEWATEQTMTGRVGGHVFFAPKGPVNGAEAIGLATRTPQADNVPNMGSTASPIMAYAPTTKEAAPMATTQAEAKPDDFYAMMGIKPPSGDAPAAQASPAGEPDFYASMGIKPPSDRKAEPAGPAPQDGGGMPALVAGAVGGLPIVGPAALSGLQHTAAFLRSNLGPQNENYQQSLDAVKKQMADDTALHPYINTAGHVAGGAAGIAAGGGAINLASKALGGSAELGSTLLGMEGPSIASKLLYGMPTNALVGGADAAVRGEDAKQGALFGAAGAAAGPVVGELASRGVNALVRGYRNILPTNIPGVDRPAANVLNRTFQSNDPAAMAAAKSALGPEGTLMDASGAATSVGRALASMDGAQQDMIRNALIARNAGAAGRISESIDTNLGNAKSAGVMDRNLGDLRSEKGAVYQDIHANSPPVDVSGVIAKIDAALGTPDKPIATGAQRTALQNLRKELVLKPESIDPATNAVIPAKLADNSQMIHNLRMDIDGMINQGKPGLGVEQGAVSRTQGELKQMRGALDETLKTQVPGMAEADAQSALLANRQTAVARGYEDVIGGGKDALDPAVYALDRAGRTAGENTAEKLGIRARIDNMFGTGPSRSVTTLANKLLPQADNNGWARQNLSQAFGEQPVNNLVDMLHGEKTFAQTHNTVVHGSDTARTQDAIGMLKQTEPRSTNVLNSTAFGAGAQAIKSGVIDPLTKMIMETSSEPRNIQIARALLAKGATGDQILQQIQAFGVREAGLQKLGSIAGDLARGGGNLLTKGYADNATQPRPLTIRR